MAATTGSPPGKERQRIVAIASLEALVGAHPEALRDIYAAGKPTDATRLGGDRPGSLLAIDAFAEAFVATRPLVRWLARRSLFRGKRFESGGTSGRDLFAGGAAFRFRCEAGPSTLDRLPTLMLRYDGYDNPWPIAARVDELRTVGDDVAIGPATFDPGRRARLLFWWGLRLD